MKKFKFLSITVTALALFLNGCSGAINSLREAGSAALEKPNVEKQLNRAKLGINLARTNSDILYNMPISVDATWPTQLSQEITPERQNELQDRYMEKDPFYATVKYSDVASGSLPTLSPIAVDFYNRVDVLYSETPDINALPGLDLQKYREFPDAQLNRVQAVKGKLYPNVEEAVISLTPESYQEDLKSANSEMKDAIEKVLSKKGEIGDIESYLESNDGIPDISAKEQELAVKEKELEELEKVADEKSNIYFHKFEEAAKAVENSISLSPQHVELAQNIKKALDSVNSGATQTGSLFVIALAKIKPSLEQLDQELLTLKAVQMRLTRDPAPWSQNAAKLVGKRSASIGVNAIYMLPYIAIGSYYSIQQAMISSKYSDIVSIILTAYETQLAQESAEAKAN